MIDNRLEMYAQEMKRSSSKPSHHPGASGDGNDSIVEEASPKYIQEDYFPLNHGNYGDPYSFAMYQHILLVVDFIYNWTMDLTHEEPLAVLVIFIFQSLGILINLILYIMASASRAMQVGMRKHVSFHHWLNLIMSLAYLSLTGWWFIWALRKSWPSVSDQFSFTWPNTNSSTTVNTTENTNSTIGRLMLNGNITNSATSTSEVKEHYTLWSIGFNSLYITHRTVAIIYYFVYIRSSFLILNSPTTENFLERKSQLVGQLTKIYDRDCTSSDTKTRVTKSTSNDSKPRYLGSSFSLDDKLVDYHKFKNMASKAFEAGQLGGDAQSNANLSTREGKSRRRQILWAENDEVINATRENSEEIQRSGAEKKKSTTKKLPDERKQRSRYDKMGNDNDIYEIENESVDLTSAKNSEKENDPRLDKEQRRRKGNRVRQ